MPIFDSAGQSAANVVIPTQTALRNLRNALEAVNDLYEWASGVQQSDLEAAPFSMTASDASDLLSAIADAHALYMIATTGQPPSTYPQAASAYIYAASQTAVIGEQ